jgi:type II secretory pathway component GspD/PulD (secretin)
MRLLLACVLFAPASVVLAQTVAPVERAEVKRFAGVQTVPSANTSPGAGRSTPITATYTDESLAKALASMGDMAGIKILLDSDFRDRTLTIRFDGETFDVALAQVLRTNRLFTKVLGERTLVVVPDTQAKHRVYDRWVATKPFPFVRNRSSITLSFTDASLKSVFEALGKASGVKVLFDPDFRDQRVSIRFEGEALEPALDQLILPLRLFLTVIEGDAIVIAPDSQAIRQRYDQGAPPAGSGTLSCVMPVPELERRLAARGAR